MAGAYTPFMAKRYNVSIPDALAERLEPHKDKISLSAVMQAALERELAQLNLSDEDKQRRASLKDVAVSAWLQRNTYVAWALEGFTQHLIDSAINDKLPDIFHYYRQLYIECRRDELIKKLVSDSRYIRFFHGLAPEVAEERASVALQYAAEDVSSWFHSTICKDFVPDFVEFFEGKKSLFAPTYLEDYWAWGGTDFTALIQSKTVKEMALRMIENQVQSCFNEQEIDALVLDFETSLFEERAVGSDPENNPE